MSFKEELLSFTHAKILFDEPMSKHTGYGIGGKAKFYAKADSLYSLSEIINLAKRYKIKHKIIGNGTNILVSDLGFNGIIIDCKRINDIFLKKDSVRAMSGASLEKLVKFALDHKLTGLESMSGIPATVGGAIVMNAGAFGHNISDRLNSVEVLKDGKIVKYDKSECAFGYRTSRFLGKKEVIVSATFSLTEAEREIIIASVETYKELRRAMHPTGRSCGSVFRNPKNRSAGMLIECAGLKGYRVGGAKVSEKHANFILAEKGAKSSDVYALAQIVKNTVANVYRIELKEEIEYLGDF